MCQGTTVFLWHAQRDLTGARSLPAPASGACLVLCIESVQRDGLAPSMALGSSTRRQSRRPDLLSCKSVELRSPNLIPTHAIKKPTQGRFCYGTPREIRTPDTQVRSLVLYPAELWAHFSDGKNEPVFCFKNMTLCWSIRGGVLSFIYAN